MLRKIIIWSDRIFSVLMILPFFVLTYSLAWLVTALVCGWEIGRDKADEFLQR